MTIKQKLHHLRRNAQFNPTDHEIYGLACTAVCTGNHKLIREFLDTVDFTLYTESSWNLLNDIYDELQPVGFHV